MTVSGAVSRNMFEMKVSEVLKETAVESSWISGITYNRPNKILTMRLGNGRTYTIPGVTRSVFDKWIRAESKGEFFHTMIKDKYTVSRLA